MVPATLNKTSPDRILFLRSVIAQSLINKLVDSIKGSWAILGLQLSLINFNKH